MPVIILPKEVRIGDEIIIDPADPNHPQENPYWFFDDRKITVEEITTLPNGCFYFIYGGDQRDSIFIDADERIGISLKGILRRL